MISYKFIVFSNSMSPEEEDEYNNWYNDVHLGDVLKIPGFVAAQRFTWTPRDSEDPCPPHKYMAIYEIETDDLDTAFAGLAAAAGTTAMEISPTLDRNVFAKVFKPIGPRKTCD